MKKLRCLFLALAVALLIVPLNFVSNAAQLQNFDTHDEVSIYGNIKIHGTPSGHITVAVDKSAPLQEIQADGVWDLVFHFAPKQSKPEYQNIALDLEGAVLAFTNRRVTVISAERHLILNLSLEETPKSNNSIFQYSNQPETVHISNGAALVRYLGTSANTEGLWLCGTEGGRCSVAEIAGNTRPSSEPAPVCPAGGGGSQNCGISCGSGLGCSIGCGAGYYACCHCEQGCHCVKN